MSPLRSTLTKLKILVLEHHRHQVVQMLETPYLGHIGDISIHTTSRARATKTFIIDSKVHSMQPI